MKIYRFSINNLIYRCCSNLNNSFLYFAPIKLLFSSFNFIAFEEKQKTNIFLALDKSQLYLKLPVGIYSLKIKDDSYRRQLFLKPTVAYSQKQLMHVSNIESKTLPKLGTQTCYIYLPIIGTIGFQTVVLRFYQQEYNEFLISIANSSSASQPSGIFIHFYK